MAETAEWENAVFTITALDSGYWTYNSILPESGGEISGVIVADSKEDAQNKLLVIYPGITFE
jgi:hypothetical protein